MHILWLRINYYIVDEIYLNTTEKFIWKSRK